MISDAEWNYRERRMATLLWTAFGVGMAAAYLTARTLFAAEMPPPW